MPEQSKFENMDLFASLEAIMKQNTGFYQSDLDIDKEIIAKAAASPHREDKTLLVGIIAKKSLENRSASASSFTPTACKG